MTFKKEKVLYIRLKGYNVSKEKIWKHLLLYTLQCNQYGNYTSSPPKKVIAACRICVLKNNTCDMGLNCS